MSADDELGRARRNDWPGTGTRLLGLVGHPIGHSLSPVMHNAALAAAGLDLAYVAVDVDADTLPVVLGGLDAFGFVGVNVTVPHKQAVASACATLTDEAAVVGAVNTVVVTADGLHGHNTDTTGFLAGLPTDLSAGHAVVVGAGGAARAVVVALTRTGWAVTVVARRGDAAAALVAQLAGNGGTELAVAELASFDLAGAPAAVAAADLVVNATPLGLAGEPLPDAFMRLRPDQAAYDLVYNPARTPFLVAAEAAGARVIGGLEMLVNQAAAAFEIWTGVHPDRQAMATAARHALADRT